MSVVRTYNFTFVEHAPDDGRVVATGRGSVELADDLPFDDWARERWPAARYTVRLDTPPPRRDR